MAKQFTFKLGGEQRTLDVGKLWYSRLFFEAVNLDPMQMASHMQDPSKQYDILVGIVYGGVNCHLKVTGGQLVDLETVRGWVGALEQEESLALINSMTAALAPKDEPQGEENAQGENP